MDQRQGKMTDSPRKSPSPQPGGRDSPAIHPSRRDKEKNRSRSPPPRRHDSDRGARTDSYRGDRGGRDRSDRRDFRDGGDRDERRDRPRRGGGFKFKDRRRDDDNGPDDRDRDRDRRGGGGLERGYRNRSSRRDRDRDRERDRDDSKYGGKKDKERKPAAVAAAAPAATGEMLVIYVNDRLGSKTAVPCLPTDTIGDLKKLVAARNGRRPHEIMLRRQGERPFKDQLTLEDYGISSGVQLDLEIDAGD